MKTSLTIFKSIFDNKTHRRMDFDSYDEFENLLYQLSKVPGYKPKKDERNHPNASKLISPAVFNTGDLRRNINVKCWGGWCALDIDDYTTSFDDALKTFSNYRFTCYSSASSTKKKPKFRIVLPLSENVQATDIKHFWFALSQEFNSLSDPQTKDLSRMYYVPAKYPGAYNFIVSNKESPTLNVFELLQRHQYHKKENHSSTLLSKLPELMQSKVAAYKQTQLKNIKYSWTGIDDCPFINKKMVLEYMMITETGWYAKMYAILLSTATKAIRSGYPITARELAALGKDLDSKTGGWYENRPLEAEAERAILYSITNV